MMSTYKGESRTPTELNVSPKRVAMNPPAKRGSGPQVYQAVGFGGMNTNKLKVPATNRGRGVATYMTGHKLGDPYVINDQPRLNPKKR